jgi:hypothetical protein
VCKLVSRKNSAMLIFHTSYSVACVTSSCIRVISTFFFSWYFLLSFTFRSISDTVHNSFSFVVCYIFYCF